jgi:hypothetical protein
MRKLRTLVFGISLEEATFKRRRFPQCEERSRLRLETVGTTFLTGYLAALAASSNDDLVRRLENVELERRGFAYEGSAMALGLMDMLLPWRRNRWRSFTSGPANHHEYMMYVGLGWALARMHRRVDGYLRRLDPLLGPLALDGYGFHECYFHWDRVLKGHEVPKHLSGYSRRAFDQGVGRASWFVNGADIERIAATISSFAVERQADLWSGVGLAAAYAGGVGEDTLRQLTRLSGVHRPALSQGVVFATAARDRAGNMATHTVLACRIICDVTIERASAIATLEREGLPHGGSQPAYEIWRERIRAHFPITIPADGGRLEPNQKPTMPGVFRNE